MAKRGRPKGEKKKRGPDKVPHSRTNPLKDVLSEKQKRFCLEYKKDYNGTKAYQRSGYAAKTINAAAVGASLLLKNPKIKAYIRELGNREENSSIVSKDWVIKGLVKNYNRAMQHESVLDKLGNPTGQFIYNGSVANRSLELIGKNLGMFEDNLNVKGTIQHDHTHTVLDATILSGLPLDAKVALLEVIRKKKEADALQEANKETPLLTEVKEVVDSSITNTDEVIPEESEEEPDPEELEESEDGEPEESGD